ncbi:NAD(P)H-binding protein [Mesonia sp.]|uniref:NAD(P)H-binding protein n=1 Tax=Mesonia sp. TaxID=1960830 RepID=UPI00176595DE|nr:NAD(P)H-binding protein [Mesonia sp.]HIB37045.1 NAD-dependent epimerase/dehydratase family protein [Mesonia sp.]HIO27295.1 NAD-dependent epimerase/dehydratase family protein [Flavobacteriaceae bacterium]
MKTKTAILLGATGLTGNLLLQQLLKDDDFQKIILFSRSSVKLQHPKLEEHHIDLFQLENYKDQFHADVVFCSIGSTQKKTPDNEAYRKVDFGIPVTAAKLAKQNNIPKMIVVSTIGADKNSRFFYNKTKGEMEEAVLAEEIAETYILRPSLIDGNREESRPFELAWKKVMRFTNFLMIGPLKKYRSIQAETIAKAMQFLSKKNYPKSIIESEEIKEIVRGVN